MRTETVGANYVYYDADTIMKNCYPKIEKLGACSPNGEMTPFVWKGRLYRLELVDPSKGWRVDEAKAGIRDVETGKFLSFLAEDSYFHSACVDGDVVYVTGVDKVRRDTIRLYESRDLKTWKSRDLLTNPGWIYFNSQLVHAENEWTIILESGAGVYPHLAEDEAPRKYVGKNGWTMFFAKSPDMKNWRFLDYEKPFSLDEHTGGPALKYSDGWYYLLGDCKIPRYVYTSYMYRTRDFETWYVGYYNPIIMPSDEDRKISPNYKDITEEERERLKTAFNVNNTDLDICEWQGKTYINYLCGNQLGNYWMCEAVCDMPLADFFKSYFE